MLRILATNDDGVFAEGLKCLVAALKDLAEVVVVAPDREQSASGHSLTLNRPLRIRQVEDGWYTVDGTPTDCVNLAVHNVLQDNPPDLVVSGINFGLNLGNDVTYSGTVSAVFEASLHGFPGIAFSQDVRNGYSFERSAALARDIVATLLEGDEPMASGLLLNVNFPTTPPKGVRWTRLGKRSYEQTVIEKQDPKGRNYYWIGGRPRWQKESGTDHEALVAGYVPMTPLQLDLTDYAHLDLSPDWTSTLRDLGDRWARGDGDDGDDG